MQLLKISALALMAQIAAQAAVADDTALVIGTQQYDRLSALRGGTRVVDAAEALNDVGFDVLSVANGSRGSLYGLISRFAAQIAPTERFVVVLSGRFATDGTRTWYMPRDTSEPTIATIDRLGIPVETLLEMISAAPGAAVIVLGADDSVDRYDRWLRAGIAAIDVPQGVTLVRGNPADVAAFVENELARPDSNLTALIARNTSVRGYGFLPNPFPFAGPAVAPTAAERPTQPDDQNAAERALWDGARALNTAEAYGNYLERFPRGRFVDEAVARRNEILSEPNRQARLAEEALQLNRDQRRAIQRALTLLTFNTRGIDGIFGPGTRGAITNWQQQNGFGQTGFLTAEQFSRIEAQAARRTAETQADAERQRQAEIQRDRAFWEETGAAGDEPGLRAYLDRYPQGLYADAARTRMATFEEQQRRGAEAEDRAAWARARANGTVDGYNAYLRAFPDGAFAAAARERIAAQTQSTDEHEQTGNAVQVEAWRQREQALGINGLTAQLVEQRLQAAGLEPGAVDGRFDDNTRRALANFQRARRLEPTGYLNEQTVVQLLAEVLQ